MEIKQFFLGKIPSAFFVFFISLALIFPPISFADLQDVVDSKDTDSVFLYLGDLVTVKVHSLTRIAVSNPGIVDVTNATVDEITLVGRKVGETPIFIWDEVGKRQIIARVLNTDLNLIATRIASLIQSADIKGVSVEKNYLEGKLILSGYLSKNEKKKFELLIKDFGSSIINLVIEEGDLIQIDVQFSELDTTLSKALGFDWTTGGGSLAFSFAESLPAQDGSFADLFKLGDFSRTSAILSVVNLLIQEGKGRILSKPSLVVTNGEQASFLVGGEIPIRSTTTSVGGGSVQENVTFKDYGVELTVTPEIRDGKIDINVNVTVRDVDSSNAVGDDVAFLTRTATTKVRLQDSQTIVLAGMIQRRQSETIKRVPFLSKIPVLGMVFKSTSNTSPDSDQELVVSLTPHILKNLKIDKREVPYNKQEPENKDTKMTDSKDSANANGSVSVQRVEEPALSTKKLPEQTPLQTKESKLLPKASVEEPKVVDVPKNDVKNDVKEASKTKVKTPAQIKAEKKAMAQKAKADARAAALKAKKEKAEQAKFEKEERAKARKDKKAKKDSKQKGIDSKITQAPTVKSTPKDKPAVAAVTPPVVSEVKSLEASGFRRRAVDDPSLNIALADPRLSDPQNVLSEQEISTIKAKYTNKIKNEMSETISYPYEAKESRWEGTATLNMTILPDGHIKNVAVSQSSGYAIFDKDAVDTAEILAPFDSFVPAKNMKEISISVPVEYSEKAIIGMPVLNPKK